MAINLSKVLKGLESVLKGYEVADGKYTGKSDKWIVFNYTDQRSALEGDDDELALNTSITLNVYTPEDYSYLKDVRTIRKYLKENGGNGITYMNYVEDEIYKTSYMRHHIFEATFTTNE